MAGVFRRLWRQIPSPVWIPTAPSGAMSGVATLTFSNTGTVTGVGALLGNASLTFANSGVLTGAVSISGVTTLTFTDTAVLTGTGVLQGSANQVFANTATLVGAGALSGASSIVFVNTGTLDQPSGAIAGSIALAFANTGALQGTGSLIGTSSILFDVTGILGGGATGAGYDYPLKIKRRRIILDGKQYYLTAQEEADLLNSLIARLEREKDRIEAPRVEAKRSRPPKRIREEVKRIDEKIDRYKIHLALLKDRELELDSSIRLRLRVIQQLEEEEALAFILALA